MERIVRLQIEKLPDGVYLAMSNDVQGLIAQGRTITETIEIARDVARRLIEAQRERSAGPDLPEPNGSFEYPMLVAV
jgi:predicted RNase H-like HicB family nuclease